MADEGRITILNIGLFTMLVVLGPVAAAQIERRECAYTKNQEAQTEPFGDKYGDLEKESEGGTIFHENATIRCNHQCFGLWKEENNEFQIVMQACWSGSDNPPVCDSRCVVTNQPQVVNNKTFRFCCCNKDMCNMNFTDDFPTLTTAQPSYSRRQVAIVVPLATVFMFTVLVVLLFFYILRRPGKHTLHSLDVLESVFSSPSLDPLDLDNLKFMELIGRGRYGSVYRVLLDEKSVAVKVFIAANRQQFTNERMIYHQLLKHENVARFLDSKERVSTEGRREYLLLLEFYPHGSLCTYLNGCTVDWLSCCRLALSVTRGLAYLHTEIRKGEVYKPAVSHRDLNSRNVLVKADGSCVISDFGLAMILTEKRPPAQGDVDNCSISEAGTVRYMAPEVLEGSVNLRDCETALKQVDVYTLGLLYWETFMRCSDLFPGETVPAFQMAFQAEAGNHPTIEDMQALVSREKERPKFPEAWKENSLTVRLLKETMEDCWDQDAEARLTAQCAEQRLSELLSIWEREKSASPALNPNTALYNHRNISTGQQTPVGSHAEYSSTRPEDHDTFADPPLVGGSIPAEKNRNCINYEWQQAQLRHAGTETSSATPVAESFNASYPPPGGSIGPPCIQLTQEDLEIPKLDPSEVQKNLRESSDESLMEHSQKQFCSPETLTSHSTFYPLMNMASEVSGSQGSSRNADGPETILPKQQNVPKRPSSLILHSKTSSLRMKFGKLGKCNLKKVEMGVAKACAVNPANEAQPIPVANNDSAARPNKIVSGSAPESTCEVSSDDLTFSLLTTSPDEQEPLLRREACPDNANNNNSNNNNGEGDGDAEDEGEGGESNENVGSTGVASSASNTEAVAPTDTCPASPTVPPQAQSQPKIHGEALLRQNRGRRPERPNSLDLSFTTLPLLGGRSDVTEGSADKIKKRVKTPYALKKWRPSSWIITTETLDAEVNNNSRHGGQNQAGTSRPKSASDVYLGGRGGSHFSTDPNDCDF
ncbi:bone morphogenetic protein receptor type-2a isoform X1 [Triplophysa dalaica]|uniref:bone morphogenetic protein receptor type-2a isoform X1 n=1 Tax=Triplophysa dalaica TaxID=1582913 RepID=UPI0024E01BEC|nr:bone morphogenetic protein receptor type-2a isoform X1 [Triplophysa dalaica]